MTAVKVEIVRFVDEHQPGFVEVALVDTAGRQPFGVESVGGETNFVVADAQIVD